MRRGRVLTGLALLVAACSLSVAPTAAAATPQEICAALQNGASITSFSKEDVIAFFTDPTIQGYGCAGVIIPPLSPTPVTPAPTEQAPAPQPCVEGTSGSNGNCHPS